MRTRAVVQASICAAIGITVVACPGPPPVVPAVPPAAVNSGTPTVVERCELEVMDLETLSLATLFLVVEPDEDPALRALEVVRNLDLKDGETAELPAASRQLLLALPHLSASWKAGASAEQIVSFCDFVDAKIDPSLKDEWARLRDSPGTWLVEMLQEARKVPLVGDLLFESCEVAARISAGQPVTFEESAFLALDIVGFVGGTATGFAAGAAIGTAASKGIQILVRTGKRGYQILRARTEKAIRKVLSWLAQHEHLHKWLAPAFQRPARIRWLTKAGDFAEQGRLGEQITEAMLTRQGHRVHVPRVSGNQGFDAVVFDKQRRVTIIETKTNKSVLAAGPPKQMSDEWVRLKAAKLIEGGGENAVLGKRILADLESGQLKKQLVTHDLATGRTATRQLASDASEFGEVAAENNDLVHHFVEEAVDRGLAVKIVD